MRKIINLNKNWFFTKDDAGPIRKDERCSGVSLPHTWNAVDGQDGGNDYYRGKCWYYRDMSEIECKPDEMCFLEFDGAAMTSDVFADGQHIAHHDGGYSTFRVNITDWLRSACSSLKLAVSVDNSINQKVYPQTADFTFYGGLYRDVKAVIVPSTHFSLECSGSSGIKVTSEMKQDTAEINVETWIDWASDAAAGFQPENSYASIKIGDEVHEAIIDWKSGKAETTFHIDHPHLWDGLKDPYLYQVSASIPGDAVETSFGIRTFQVFPDKGVYLNGHPYPLRGVSRHQDRKDAGNALTNEMHEEDMNLILEMGANAVRLAHYQHSQYFYDLCDRKGITVWAEIPYITMHMTQGNENSQSQMKELILQNYNHPSIMCWCLSNEITAASEVNQDLIENHQKLNDLCHALDQTRPTAMAHAFMLENDSPMLSIADINTYNLYFGWYLGSLDQNDDFLDSFHERYPEKPMGLSEYGADANPSFHSSSPERGDYSEEYQCLFHEHMLQMISERPWLWCTFVWNMFDFAADGRDEGGAHGINQKGLVTMDRRIKKDAFYLYKAYWSSQPFVHICGKRYTDRIEDEIEIKVYSNLPEVTLFVNQKKMAVKMGSHIFRFIIQLPDHAAIRAEASGMSDICELTKVQKENPKYSLGNNTSVKNWFDSIEIHPDCYSVNDTMGELSSNAQAGAIVQAMMSQASASRGDIAEKVKNNPNLQRMMQRQTLISLLHQAGDSVPEEAVKQLNQALQKIKKI